MHAKEPIGVRNKCPHQHQCMPKASDGVEYLTSKYEYCKKLRVQVLILKNALEYEYRKKVRVRVLLQILQKKNFSVVTAQSLSQKHKRIRFFSIWDVEKAH